MWQLIKAEFQYSNVFIWITACTFPIYTIFTLFDYQLLTGPQWEIDYWGGLFSIVFYLLLFIVWSFRIREFRIRIHTLLPLSAKQISQSRLFFTILPLLFSLIYLIVIHLIIIRIWHAESLSIIGQLGLIFTILSSFILIRDIWFIFINKRMIHKTIIIAIAIAATCLCFTLLFIFVRPAVNYSIGRGFGITVFGIWAVILSIFTIVTFQKRKSFLV